MKATKIHDSIINRNLDKLNLDSLAREKGFYKRKPQKITAQGFLLGFISMIMLDKYSFRCWATQLGLLTSTIISKQAVWKRCTSDQIEFLQSVIEKLFSLNTVDFISKLNACTLLSHFNHVYIQDSTCISLPDHFAGIFPGNRCNGIIKAVLKIQTVFDIKTNQFHRFELTNYSKNDQKASIDIIPIIKDNDLIIRDLGYFASSIFKLISDQKAFFLSRLKLDTHIYSIEGQKIDLLKILKKRKYLDIHGLMSAQMVPVRLIAIKIPDPIANERKRKARNDRDKRVNHNHAYYEMLGYNFFVTNIQPEKITCHEIALIYQIRWRIETFFKCWKSNFNLSSGLKNTQWTENSIRCYILCLLIFIALTHTQLFHFYWWRFYQEKKIHLSLSKFSEFLSNNIFVMIMGNNLEETYIEDLIAYSCKYETRTDRKSFSEKILSLNFG